MTPTALHRPGREFARGSFQDPEAGGIVRRILAHLVALGLVCAVLGSTPQSRTVALQGKPAILVVPIHRTELRARIGHGLPVTARPGSGRRIGSIKASRLPSMRRWRKSGWLFLPAQPWSQPPPKWAAAELFDRPSRRFIGQQNKSKSLSDREFDSTRIV